MSKPGKICQNVDTVKQPPPQGEADKNLVGTTKKEKGYPSWKQIP